MKLTEALQWILREGPLTQNDLLIALEQVGQGRASLGAIWQTCQEHGLADLNGDTWVPRGWAAPVAQPAGSALRKEARLRSGARAADDDGLGAAARKRISALRAELDLDQPVELPATRVSEDWTGAVREAIGALSDELSAVSRQRTQTDVPLRAGQVVAVGATRTLMRFEADSEVSAREGTSATLVIRPGETVEVDVISVFGAEVTLSLSNDAPTPDRAVLRCDLSWLLSTHSKRMHELSCGAPGFDTDAALAMVTPAASSARSVAGRRRWGSLNDTQSLAVDHGLGDGVTWLWGPPGTGKTTTLAVLLEELQRRGRRILLTAPTNTAVDIALQALLGRMETFATGSVVRVGQPTDTGLVKRASGPVLVDEIAELRGEPVAADLTHVDDQIRTLRSQLREYGRSSRRTGKAYDDLQVELAERQAMARALRGLLAEVRRQVCQDAILVAATAHQLLLPTLSGLTFDVVVIDEASMLPASLSMIAAGAGRGHTVVAGDFRQLPPVVIAQTPRADRWLRNSAFESSGVAGAVAGRRPPSNLVALTEQHRMPAPLAEAISDGFYPESRLRTADSVRRRPPRAGLRSTRPIVCVDTSVLRSRVARRGGQNSRYNLVHALINAALVADHGLVGPEPALITPYAPQAKLLEALVGDDEGRGIASTVHRFQGGERDVVIFDAVEAAGSAISLHPWFSEPATSDGARLLNVAMSRARERLVVVADLDRIHRRRPHDDSVGAFFRSALAGCDYLNPFDVIARHDLQQPDLGRLFDDIDNATSTIEIWSEFVDTPVAKRLVPHLQDAAQRGCTATVWYQPRGTEDVPPGFAELVRSDVALRPCTPLRESLAVADDVVWASTDPLLQPAQGTTLRLAHHELATATLRATRRRNVLGDGGSRFASRCGCGRLQVRRESFSSARLMCRTCEPRPVRTR